MTTQTFHCTDRETDLERKPEHLPSFTGHPCQALRASLTPVTSPNQNLRAERLRNLVQFTIAQMGKLRSRARPPNPATPAYGPALAAFPMCWPDNPCHAQCLAPLSSKWSIWAKHGLGKRGSSWQQRRQPVVIELQALGPDRPESVPGTAPPSWAAPLGARFPSCAVVTMALVCAPGCLVGGLTSDTAPTLGTKQTWGGEGLWVLRSRLLLGLRRVSEVQRRQGHKDSFPYMS